MFRPQPSPRLPHPARSTWWLVAHASAATSPRFIGRKALPLLPLRSSVTYSPVVFCDRRRMALTSLQDYVVADLCVGKPSARSIPPTATISDALRSFRSGENRLVVWITDDCAWKVCVVDILCYLCAEENLEAPMAALSAPVSVLLLHKAATVVRRLDPDSSILEALDAIVDGARTFLVPIRSKIDGRGGGGNSELCWLTQEDFVRFFLNFIPFFSSVSALSITELALVRPASLTVLPRDPALSALPLIRAAHSDQTSVAVVSDDGCLVGEISPSALSHCDERVAAAVAALSTGDLVSFLDYIPPPASAVRSIKEQLRVQGRHGMLELLQEGDFSPPFSPSSSSSSSSSSDEEYSWPGTAADKGRRPRRVRSMKAGRWAGSYSAPRMGRRSNEAIVCRPWSSLVAVMIQALAHRVSYLWVVDVDYLLAGAVTFSDMLRIFREQLEQYNLSRSFAKPD